MPRLPGRVSLMKLWCKFCVYRTKHECQPDVQAEGGLYWKCAICQRSEVFTAYQVSLGERA